MTTLRSFLRRFRETVGRVDISVGPVSFRFDRDEFERPEPRMKAGTAKWTVPIGKQP